MEDINAETMTSAEILSKEKKLIFQAMKVIHDRYKLLGKSCQEPSQSLIELQRTYSDYLRDRLNNLGSKTSSTLSQPVEELRHKFSENAEITVTLGKTDNSLQSRDNKLKEKIGELYAELKENDLVEIEIEFLSQARGNLEEDAKNFHGPAQKQNSKLAELRRGKQKLAQAIKDRHVKAEYNQNTNLLNRKIKIPSEQGKGFHSVEHEKSVTDLLDLLDETHEHVTEVQQICEMLCNGCTFRTQPLTKGEEFDLKYLQEENTHFLGTIIALSRDNVSLLSQNGMSEGETNERIEEIRNNNLLLKTKIQLVSKEKETLGKKLKLLENEELARGVLEEQFNQLKIKYFDHEDTIEEDKKALRQEKPAAEEELGKLNNEKYELKKQLGELDETYNSLHVEFENLKAYKSEQDEEMNQLKHRIETLNNENEETLKQFEDLKQPSICEEESRVQYEKLEIIEENFCSLIDEEQQQMEELQQTIEKLNEENISKGEQIEKLKRSEQEQRENIKLLNKVKDLREQIEVLQAQKSQLEEKRNELDEKVKRNNSLKKETQSLEEKRDASEENQNKPEYGRGIQISLNEKIVKLQEEDQAVEHELNKNIAEFNKLMHKLIGECISFRAACKELENLEAKQYEQLTSSRNQIHLLEFEKEKLEEKLRQLIEAKEKSRSELEEKVNELKIKYSSEKGTLEQERNILEQELLRAEEELRKVINERNKLKERLMRTDQLKDTDKSTRQRVIYSGARARQRKKFNIMEHTQRYSENDHNLTEEKGLIFQAMKIFHDKYVQLEKSCKEQMQLLDEIQKTYLDYIEDQLCNFEPEEFSTFRQPDKDSTRRSNKSIRVTIKINQTNTNSNLQQNKLMAKFNELSEKMKENDLLGLQIQLLGKEIKELDANLKEFYKLKPSENINKQRFGQKTEEKQTNIELMEKHLLTVFAKEKKNLEEYLKLLENLKQEQKFRLETQLNSFENERPTAELFVPIDETEQRVLQLQQISNMLSTDRTTTNERLRKHEEFEENYLRQENTQLLGSIRVLSRENEKLRSQNSVSKKRLSELDEEKKIKNALKAQLHSLSDEKASLEENLKQLESRTPGKAALEEELSRLKTKYFVRKETTEKERSILEKEKLTLDDEIIEVTEEKNALNRRLNELNNKYALLHANVTQLKDREREQEDEMNLLKHQIEILSHEKDKNLKQLIEETSVQHEKVIRNQKFFTLPHDEHQQIKKLQQTIDKLTEDSAGKTEQIERLKKSVQEQEEYLYSLETVKQLRKKIEALQCQKSKLKEELKELNEKVKENNLLTEEIESLEVERDKSKENQNNSRETQLSSDEKRKKLKAKYSLEKDMLEQEFNSLQQKKLLIEEELNKVILEFNEPMRKLIGEFTSLCTAFEDLDNLEVAQRDELNSLKNQIVLLELEKQNLERKLTQLEELKQQRMTELEEKLIALKIKYSAEIETLQKERNSLEQKLFTAEEELRIAINERSKLKGELDKVRRECAELQADYEKQDNLEREKEKEQNLLKTEMGKSDIPGFKGFLYTIQNLLETPWYQLETALKNKQEQISRNIENVERQLYPLQQEELAMKQKLTEITEEINKSNKKSSDLNVEIQSLEASHQTLKDRQHTLQEEVALLKHKIQLLDNKQKHIEDNLEYLEKMSNALEKNQE
uniref:Uncharacterized protein n=1 Tax=Glossina palpalis gambiensis TaxID=67801 RepID=A0A1B0BU72_9MUSC